MFFCFSWRGEIKLEVNGIASDFWGFEPEWMADWCSVSSVSISVREVPVSDLLSYNNVPSFIPKIAKIVGLWSSNIGPSSNLMIDLGIIFHLSACNCGD